MLVELFITISLYIICTPNFIFICQVFPSEFKNFSSQSKLLNYFLAMFFIKFGARNCILWCQLEYKTQFILSYCGCVTHSKISTESLSKSTMMITGTKSGEQIPSMPSDVYWPTLKTFGCGHLLLPRWSSRLIQLSGNSLELGLLLDLCKYKDP